MRIGIDATSLLGQRTGVGTVTHEVITRLAERPGIELTAFAITWRGRGLLTEVLPANTRIVNRPMAARPLRRAWRSSNRPPIEWWTGPLDVVHGPNFVVPPARRAAEVVTVHDLTCLRFPQMCTSDTLEYPALITRAVERGAWIHTVSPFVADEVRAAFAIEPDRVVTAENGVTPVLPADPGRGHRLAGGPRYILGLGTIEPRKDFPLLVQAFDALAGDDPDLRLVIAGPDGWGLEALTQTLDRARHRDRVVRLGWLPDEDRAALLRGASVFAFPSVYEGFGLPPLEAMTAGVPVVASDAGALVHTVGEGGLLVPTGDVDALAGALARVLSDDVLATGLVRKGTANVARFSWTHTVDGLVDLYHRAAASAS